MDDLGRALDSWMRQQDRWVPSAEIEARFGVGERKLRFDGDTPGLLSFNCISSSEGYKHIERATDAEFAAAYAHDIKPLKTRFFVIRQRRNHRRAFVNKRPDPHRPLPIATKGQGDFFA